VPPERRAVGSRGSSGAGCRSDAGADSGEGNAFYLNGQLSHCGVNVFQIARVVDEWEIVGLADTRRRDGCEEWLK
jgi:hypothetical protein